MAIEEFGVFMGYVSEIVGASQQHNLGVFTYRQAGHDHFGDGQSGQPGRSLTQRRQFVLGEEHLRLLLTDPCVEINKGVELAAVIKILGLKFPAHADAARDDDNEEAGDEFQVGLDHFSLVCFRFWNRFLQENESRSGARYRNGSPFIGGTESCD